MMLMALLMLKRDSLILKDKRCKHCGVKLDIYGTKAYCSVQCLSEASVESTPRPLN